jgi:hypothetical protein
MTQRLNPNIATALDMELPPEEPVEASAPLVIVEPHEIVTVANDDLPDMSDLEVKTIQGEKQLEQVISAGMGMFKELYEELGGIDPKYRNRHLETTALIMGHTLDAIKHKTGHQMKRKKQRMEEASFGVPDTGTKIGTANFYGSREDLMKLMSDATVVDVPQERETK